MARKGYTTRHSALPGVAGFVRQAARPPKRTHTHPAPGSRLRWELETADTGCILRLSHVVPDVQEAIDGCYLVGLQTSLARLEPSLAGLPEPWDWDAFAIAQAHYAGIGLAAPVDPS